MTDTRFPAKGSALTGGYKTMLYGCYIKSWKEGDEYRCCYFGGYGGVVVYELNGDTWTENETLSS